MEYVVTKSVCWVLYKQQFIVGFLWRASSPSIHVLQEVILKVNYFIFGLVTMPSILDGSFPAKLGTLFFFVMHVLACVRL